MADPGTLEPLVGSAVTLAEAALRRGILVLPAGAKGHVLELSPPLVLTDEQARWAAAEMVDLVRMVGGRWG